MRIAKDQRGLVFRNGDFSHLLSPGLRFVLPGLGRVEVYDAMVEFCPKKDLSVFLQDEKIKQALDIIEVGDHEVALHFADGNFVSVLVSGKHAFWKGLKERSFVKVDLRNPLIDETIDRSVLSRPELREFILAHTVESYEKGLLFIDRAFVRLLGPGNYYFWRGQKTVTVVKADMRQQKLEITGQEIMTKDKVMLRLNYMCQYHIADPVKALNDMKEYESQLYVLIQLVLREYIGSLTLDELLQKKEEVGTFISEKLHEQAKTLGVEMVFSGIKDIILPGDVRDIMNQVLIAEKKALANVITRREETASTRSLLNTAKLMEENAVLFKLKELEYVERISERINQITLHGGSHVIDQLRQIFVPSEQKKD